MKKSLLLSLCLLLFWTNDSAAQCLLKHVPLNNKITNASHVIEGKVVDKVSFWDNGHKNIYTRNKVEIYKIFKGSVQGNYIEIITEGGTVGNDMDVVEPSLNLTIGETGVFACTYTNVDVPFSHASSIPQFDAYASVQGFIKYDINTLKASAPFETFSDITTVLYPSLTAITNSNYQTVKKVSFSPSQTMQLQSGTTINSISPTTATAGTKTQLTIVGSLFGATQGSGYVEFKDANDGGSSGYQPLASEYVLWKDDTIIVEIPSRAGTGTVDVVQTGTGTSPQTLTISYSQLNVSSAGQTYMPDHINDNTLGGYTFNMNTNFDANAVAKASFLRALDTWRCNTGINWINGTTTGTDSVGVNADGINIVRFDIGAELPGGVLGRCTSRRSGCGTPLSWTVSEIDIVFDDGTTWAFGPAAPLFNEYDFETVALHELGHGHQLGHVISPGAVMHYSISNGSQNRTLGANDLAGGNYVQSQSTAANACGPAPMTAYACSGPPVADFSTSSTTVCSGDVVTFSDLSTNSPTSWSWAFQGGTPSTSTLQNPAITFNNAGVYTVTLTATNNEGSDSETKVGYITVGACTQLGTAYCGITLNNLSDVFYWHKVSGAGNYQIRFINTATSFTYTATRGNKLNNWAMSWTNPGFQYNTTYDVQVRAYVGGSWSSYGPVCQLTTPALAPTASVLAPHCGGTVASLNEIFYWNAVPGALNYQIEFVNSAASFTYTATRGSSLTNWAFGWTTPSPPFQYNTTYNVRVRANVAGVWGNYGAMCQITTPGATPTTSLQPAFCNTILPSMGTIFYWDKVPGASNYQIRFTNSVASFTYTVARGNNLNNWALNWTTPTPGFQPSTTYDVEIRPYTGAGWGNWGAICELTTPGVIIAPNPGTLNYEGFITYGIEDDNSQYNLKYDGNGFDMPIENTKLGVTVYPNPSQDGNITMSVSNVNTDRITITLHDISGRELYNQTHPVTTGNLNIISNEFTPLDLAKGIYIIRVSAGDEQVYNKLIIE